MLHRMKRELSVLSHWWQMSIAMDFLLYWSIRKVTIETSVATTRLYFDPQNANNINNHHCFCTQCNIWTMTPGYNMVLSNCLWPRLTSSERSPIHMTFMRMSKMKLISSPGISVPSNKLPLGFVNVSLHDMEVSIDILEVAARCCKRQTLKVVISCWL